MVFLSNYLVFKIVLAALGRVDYPVAGDLELKYDTANKIYLSGGSLDYVDDATLYTTIAGETTSYGLLPSLTANGTVPPLIKTIIGGGTNYYVGSGYGGPRSFNMSNGGTVLVAGAYGYNSNQGLIYIYEREAKNRGEWKLKQTIYGNLGTSANFGNAVSINDVGDRIFVGADTYSSNAGRVLVYDRGSDGLFPDTPTHTLTGSNGGGYVFGWAIDCNGAGDKLIVGARNEPNSNGRGAHHLYELSGGTWTRTYHRVEGSSNRRYGWSVAMNKKGDRFVVGGSYPNGWIWIFHYENGSWVQKTQISNPVASNEFGWYVAMNDVGNRVAVGCNTNRAYIYDYNGTSWSLFTSKTDNISGHAGVSLTPRGDYIAIHSLNASPFGSNPGAAYIYKISDTGTLTLVHTFTGEANDDNLGWHVYMSDDLADVVMGAKGNDEGGSNAGKLYVYGLDGRLRENIYITDAGKYSVDATIAGLNYKTNELEVTTLNPGNAVYTNDLKETSEIDHGTATGAGLKSCSVSLDGTRVAFGFSNGKAKVYHLETGVWTLKKEYTKSGTFGTQVCLNDAGTRLFVSDPSDSSNTGKVYVYDYSGSAWGSSETHSWTSPNGSTSDRFGGHAAKGISCNSAGTRLLVVNGYTGSKKAYIFDHNGSSWNTAPTKSWSSGSSWWGSYCALNDAGDRAFIGYQNGIDIFHYDGSNWPTSATKNYTGSDSFGVSLTINGAGTRLLTSSYNYSSGAGQTTLYDYVGGSWNTSATQTINGSYGGNSYYGSGINMSRDGKRYLVSAHNAATYFSGSGFVNMMEDTTGSGSFTLKQIFKPDQANENMGSYSFEEGLCLDQKGYTAVIVSAGQEISRIYSSYPIPTLDFDNYNKLSLTNTPTNTSSKLFLGSNVYDIGTLTSDLTIETPGLYRGLVFDTSSNVAYFNKTTVGAIGTTMAGYEVESIIPGYGTTDSWSQGGFGSYMDFSGDGTRMVTGMGMYNITGQYDGRAAVYHLENGSWVQKVDLVSTNTSGTRFGDSVCMSDDGTRIAVNFYQNSTIKIYDYASGAWPTSPTVSISTTVANGDMDMNKAGTVIVTGEGEGGDKAYIHTRAANGTWSETKQWGGRGGLGNGVAINGAGTRVLIGQRNASGSHPNYVGKVYEANYDSGTSTWSSLTEVYASAANTVNWPTRIRMDEDGTTAVIMSGTNGQGRILERQSGTSWTSVMDVQGKCSFYSRGSSSISYDGTMILTGDNSYNPGSVSSQGRAYLYQYSGGSWSLTKTFENPKTTPVVSDGWGYGTAIAKNTKDRFAIGMPGDGTYGSEYGSVRVYTNAIPDFISFDTYNKLSLSGLTNPTSKIHALPTGAESTTTYDIGSATNIYIESAGTYTAEMKAATKFALDSNVVGGSITEKPYNATSIVSWTNLGTTLTSDTNNITFSGYVDWDTTGTVSTSFDSTNNAVVFGGGNVGLQADFTSLRSDRNSNLWVEYEVYLTSGDMNTMIGLGKADGGNSDWFNWNGYRVYVRDANVGTGTSGNVPTGQWVKLAWKSDYIGSGNRRVSALLDSGNGYEEIAYHTGAPMGAGSNYLHDTGVLSYIRLFYTDGNGSASTTGNKIRNIHIFSDQSDVPTTPPSLTFDTYNKYTFTGADTGSTYKLKYESNTYDLGTISNVYIAHPGTYSAEIKGATNFALSSNVTGTVSEPTISGPVSIEWASLNYSNFDGSGGKAAIGTTGGILVLDGTFNTSATSPYVGTAIDITGASTGDHNFKYTIPFKPKSQSFELSFKASQPSSGTTFQVYLGYLTLNWSTAQGWNTSGDSRQKVVNLYAPAGSTIYLAGMTGQSLNQSSYTYDSTKPFVITSDTSTLKIEHNGNSKSIDLTATHEDSSGGTVADPEYYLWMAFDENSSNGLYNLSDVTYSVGGEVIKAFPTLSFDGYNKLSFSNIAPTTSNVTFDGNTYSIGTASNVYIENTGTYEAESKGTTTFALTSNVVGTVPQNPTDFPDLLTYNGYNALSINGTSINSIQIDLAEDADTAGITLSNASGSMSVVTNSSIPNGMKSDQVFSFSGPGFSKNIPFTVTDSGTYDCYFNMFDFSSSGNYNSYNHWGWWNMTLEDSSSQTLTISDWVVEAVRSGHQTWTDQIRVQHNNQSYSSGNYGEFSFKVTFPSPGTYTVKVFSVAADNTSNHSGKFNMLMESSVSKTYITPTSTTLKYGSNTYEIGSATNIYVENTGAYTAEIGGAADFAFTSNTVSGTIKTIEPGFASRYQGSMALTYDGKLYAWGMNDDGEAGVGTSSDITVPTLCTGITQGTVAKLLSSSDLTDNSRGEVSAIKTTDGKIYMAGKGDNNCIPGKTSDQTSFTDVTSYFGDQSLTANTVTMMSFTDASGAALTETGNVWTWGTHDSTYKRLGQASASSSSTPKQINFSSATGTITKVTCGHYHTVALDSSGDVWFWGKNGINSIHGLRVLPTNHKRSSTVKI